MMTLLTMAAFAGLKQTNDTPSYTITFKTTGANDGSTALTTIEEIIASGSEYVSEITKAVKVYLGGNNRGIKLGSSSANGEITLRLAESIKPSKIVVKARKYNDNQNEITVNGTAFTLADDTFDDCVLNYDGNTTVSEIAIVATKRRAFISSIDVYLPNGDVPEEDVYTVAGNNVSLFGSSWNLENTSNDMTKIQEGLYQLQFHNKELTAGNIQYRIYKNRNQATCWPESNAILNIPKSGNYDVCFTFNADTHEVGATATLVLPESTAVFDFNQMTLPVSDSNGSHDGDITEDFILTKGDITLTISPIEFGNTNSRFWSTSSGPQLRCYATSTLTITAFGTIKNVTFGANNSNLSVGSIDIENKIWTGAANSVVFTVTGSIQINSISVTVAGGYGDYNFSFPEGCTFVKDRLFAYFEKPDDWNGDIKVWAWNDTMNFTPDQWPGVAAKKVGTRDSHEVWQWIGPEIDESMPSDIIFSVNGNPQTQDLVFVNGGYYTNDAVMPMAVADMSLPIHDESLVISEEEWNMLKSYYLSIESSEWNTPWDFSPNITSVKTLPGVTAADGHVVAVDLSANNLTGTFPFSLLQLPYINALNVSNNQLSGDIGQGMADYIQTNSFMPSVRDLNISSNQFTGNIGQFAVSFPNLQSLNASHNHFDTVNPMIAETVTSLNLSSQTLTHEVNLQLNDVSTDAILSNFPNIFLYNHEAQDFIPQINLSCTYNDWTVAMDLANGEMTIPSVSTQNVYRGENGGTVFAKVLKSNHQEEGSTFNMHLYFDEGDANFNGKTDVLDLQTTINYMFNEYNNKPFNFTAANLWQDATINVQDVVCLVNLLLEQNNTATSNSSNLVPRMNASVYATASVYIQDGNLYIESSLPVSAFSIIMSGASDSEIVSSLGGYGITCRIKKNNGRTHLLGYSLNGGTLPVGKNVIAENVGGTIVKAMLADINADEIPVSANGSPTDIRPSTYTTPSSIYDLQGRRIINEEEMKSGVYIINHHKFIKK
jgi:hypothetical protein